ncbi:MAG: ribose 5-phosphate isomerase B [Acidimicrobiia bacterium]|nr:ribose 5-phosphate isomerase B [Acidimicrobiia bacterium]
MRVTVSKSGCSRSCRTSPTEGRRVPPCDRRIWEGGEPVSSEPWRSRSELRVAIGADHAGYPLKEHLLSILQGDHDVIDLGTHSTAAVDYPDLAIAVAEAVRCGEADRGIIVCGSGVGAAIAANKVTGIRAALAHDHYSAHQGVEHDDANVLCLGGRVVGSDVAEELVEAFLGATFSGEERHRRRLAKIARLEEGR